MLWMLWLHWHELLKCMYWCSLKACIPLRCLVQLPLMCGMC